MKQLFDSGLHYIQRVEVYGISMGVIELKRPLETTIYANLEPGIQSTSDATMELAKEHVISAFRDASCSRCDFQQDCVLTTHLDMESMMKSAQ